MSSDVTSTAFHGSSRHYQGSYSSQRLVAVTDRLFNNDPQAHVVRDAMRLRDYLVSRSVA